MFEVTFLSGLAAESRLKILVDQVIWRLLSAAVYHSDGECVEGIGTAGIVCAIAVIAHNGS